MPEKVQKSTSDFLSKLRSNPWMLSTVILGVLFVIVIFAKGSAFAGSSAISEQEASAKVLNFLNSKVQSGEVTIDSVSQEKGLYKFMVSYQGQQIPVYSTLDGTSLISDLVAIDGSVANPNSIQAPPSKAPVVIDSSKIANAPYKGSINAPVTIVEFSDFQCPFCERFYSETLSQIEEEYVQTGKAKLIYMNFPLSIHPQAQKAAEASLCANAQGKFWEMHNKLFDNQASLSVDNEKKWARDLGMNGNTFDKCLDSGQFAKEVEAQFNYGSEIGVTGTPAFFINGQILEGAYPFESFKQIIDAELAK